MLTYCIKYYFTMLCCIQYNIAQLYWVTYNRTQVYWGQLNRTLQNFMRDIILRDWAHIFFASTGSVLKSEKILDPGRFGSVYTWILAGSYNGSSVSKLKRVYCYTLLFLVVHEIVTRSIDIVEHFFFCSAFCYLLQFSICKLVCWYSIVNFTDTVS